MPANKSALLRYRVIDNCLTNPNRKYPTIDQIREKVEEQLDQPISISMLNKDFQSMKRIYNAPILFHRYHKGYYYSEPGFSIKEFPLTHEEITALDYSTAILKQLKGTALYDQFEKAINKLIEGYRIERILGKSEKQILQVEEPVSNSGSRYIEKLLSAIVEKNALDISYQSYDKSSPTHHVFSTYLVKEYRNRWYAIGHSNKGDDILVLALDRIAEMKPSSEPYFHDETFDPAEFFQYSFGITQFHDFEAEEVVLSFTPRQARYILSQQLHHSQQVILQDENEVRIRMKVYLTQELFMCILGYGDQVKVISPLSLQERVKETILCMNRLYGSIPSTK